MHTRLTKEGRAVRSAGFKVIGWLVMAAIVVGSILLIAPTLGSWLRSTPRQAPPPAMASAPRPTPAPPAVRQPPSPQIQRQTVYRPVYIPTGGERVERHYYFQWPKPKNNSKEAPKPKPEPKVIPQQSVKSKPKASSAQKSGKPEFVGPLPAQKAGKKSPPPKETPRAEPKPTKKKR